MEHWVWDIDPTILRLGPLQIRYYGIIFASVLLIGFSLWKWLMQRAGYPEEKVYAYFYIMTAMGILGARLGHCLFYEPMRYLSDPITILYVWKGGLASHGGTIGLILGTVIYSRVYRIPWMLVVDVTAIAAAVIATLVRVGNFFNSEIIGRITDVPWAVHFPRAWDRGEFARHPSQIYEALMGLAIFFVLLFIAKKLGNRRPRGLMTGVFLTTYFCGRFFVEFFKAHQTLDPNHPLTMGQYLSIPFFILGLGALYLAYKDRGRLSGELPEDVYVPEKTTKKYKPNRKKKK